MKSIYVDEFERGPF